MDRISVLSFLHKEVRKKQQVEVEEGSSKAVDVASRGKGCDANGGGMYEEASVFAREDWSSGRSDD